MNPMRNSPRFRSLSVLFGVLALVAAAAPNLMAGPFFRGPTGGSGGLAPGLHEVTLAGQPAHIIVGTGYSESRPTYLCYYLHGDEGGYTFNSGASSPMRQFIDRHGLVYVAPRAPEAPQAPGVFPWDGRSGGSQQGNAAQVREVLDHMLDHYNVHRDKVLGSGASGGSWFHDAVFFPQNGATYPSYFNLCCGAAGMRVGYFTYNAALALSQNADAVAASQLKYTIGTSDFLYANATNSVPTYAALGFSVQTEFLAGVGHCAFNVGAEIAEYWSETLAAFETAGLRPSISQVSATGSIQLGWDSRPGRTYTIQQSTHPSAGEDWTTLATVPAAPPPTQRTTYSDTGTLLVPGRKERLYRIAVVP